MSADPTGGKSPRSVTDGAETARRDRAKSAESVSYSRFRGDG